MELKHLRYFIAVAEELHFGRAAERLGIAQPPLSRQIRYLEQYLNAELFQRTSRHVELTPAGKVFWAEAIETLRVAEHARQSAMRADRGELGELSIGFFPAAPLIDPIAATFREFRQLFPTVHLNLHERAFFEGLQDLRNGSLDLCLLRNRTPPPCPEGTELIEILSEDLVVLIYNDHPLAKGEGPVALGDLALEAMIHFSSGQNNALLSQVTQLCREAGFEPRIEQEAGQNSTIVGLVAAGMGISILPPSICQIGKHGTCTRPIQGDGPLRSSAWLVYNAGNRLAQNFADAVRRNAIPSPR
nr:LysR substrate-binding domain-containing protein [Rhizobium sp. ACO-34A]